MLMSSADSSVWYVRMQNDGCVAYADDSVIDVDHQFFGE